MRKYESIVVFNPSLSEVAIKDELKKIEKILSSAQAQNVKIDNWGRKQIAYLVEKQSFGTFVCLSYECENHEVTNLLSAQLRITDAVIKFQSHRFSDRVRKFKGNPKRKPSVMQAQGDEFYSDSSASEY